MLRRSPSGASEATAAWASFSAGTDSPVRADSSHFRDAAVSRRASAGTKSPASSRMTSPVTRSLASTTDSLPSRSTRAWGAERFLRASSAFSALLSCSTPITALAMTMATMRMGSKNSEASPEEQATTKDTTAAASRIRIITSLNWSRKRRNMDFFFFSRRRFSPSRARRAAASASVRPEAGSVESVRSSSLRSVSCGVKVSVSSLFVVGDIVRRGGGVVTGQKRGAAQNLRRSRNLLPFWTLLHFCPFGKNARRGIMNMGDETWK